MMTIFFLILFQSLTNPNVEWNEYCLEGIVQIRTQAMKTLVTCFKNKLFGPKINLWFFYYHNYKLHLTDCVWCYCLSLKSIRCHFQRSVLLTSIPKSYIIDVFFVFLMVTLHRFLTDRSKLWLHRNQELHELAGLTRGCTCNTL